MWTTLCSCNNALSKTCCLKFLLTKLKWYKSSTTANFVKMHTQKIHPHQNTRNNHRLLRVDVVTRDVVCFLIALRKTTFNVYINFKIKIPTNTPSGVCVLNTQVKTSQHPHFIYTFLLIQISSHRTLNTVAKKIISTQSFQLYI